MTRLSISVKEARKILGIESKNLSNEDIEQLLADLEKMADIGLKMAQERKSAVV